jgi:hypothetical protein
VLASYTNRPGADSAPSRTGNIGVSGAGTGSTVSRSESGYRESNPDDDVGNVAGCLYITAAREVPRGIEPRLRPYNGRVLAADTTVPNDAIYR